MGIPLRDLVSLGALGMGSAELAHALKKNAPIQNNVFVTNRVAMGATDAKLPRFCRESRSGCNGLIPGPKNVFWGKTKYIHSRMRSQNRHRA